MHLFLTASFSLLAFLPTHGETATLNYSLIPQKRAWPAPNLRIYVHTTTETYVCTSVPLDPEAEHYLTGYKANVASHNAHHILLFGCEEPGSDDEV
ncbi:hypothetical protein ANCDUO_25266, partial [Ancylostoma duodenale]